MASALSSGEQALQALQALQTHQPPDPSRPQQPPPPQPLQPSVKCCWVCYGTEADADATLNDWVQPCSCRGTSRWVHQACLQKWVDVMQKGNINRKISCPQCKTEYILVFQSMGFLVSVLDTIEEITHKVCPFITGGALLGSIYWTAITYGAVTVMQVLGHEEGLEMLEAADPILLLVFLPAVPAVLICERVVRWEDTILRAIQSKNHSQSSNNEPVPNDVSFNTEPPIGGTGVSLVVGGSNSPTRILCSALVLPTVSTIVGRLLFNSVRNNFHRATLGGLTYLLLRGAVTIYHKQKLFIRQSSRKILDYTASNLRLYAERSIRNEDRSADADVSSDTN